MPTTHPGINNSRQKGFTLIELLIVIAIIAILAVVVVLVLNPAELLKQSRDSQRLSDLATLNSAVNLYITDQSGAAGFSLGTSSLAYLSVPDPNATSTASTDCSDMGANFLAGGYFQCAASPAFRSANSTGWIPINFSAISSGSPFGSLPVDPTNSTSSNLYYTYQPIGSTFRITAVPESQKYQSLLVGNPLAFSVGSAANLYGTWVPVPGNSTFGTQNFMVMKYDASCAQNGTALSSPIDGGGYDNSSQSCSTANGLAPSALPSAIPIVDVSEAQAKQYCASIGAHLLTNDEYMTINTNAVNQGSNWYGGTVGTNYVYSGHNDDNPSNASVASANDAQSCVGTDGPSSCGGTGANTSQIRTYTLSNGSIVWDMSGNLLQEVQRSSENVGDDTNTITPPTCSTGTAGWEWCQWNSPTPYVTAYNDSSFSAATVAPPNNTWTSAQGMGVLYTYGSGAKQGTNAFLRSGSWPEGGIAGPFTLSLKWNPGDIGSAMGFRCAR